MAHTVISQATVPGTTATVTIERHGPQAFVVIHHAPFALGGNGSYGRDSEQEARATANFHWQHIVDLRNKAQEQAASEAALLADQQVPGLPGVTYGEVAAAYSDTGAEPTAARKVNPHYGQIKKLRSELADALAALVPDHGNYRVACSLPSEDRVRFFRVDTPQKGRWAGAVFIKEQAGDDLFPVKGVAREQIVIKALLADVKNALVLYGLELGSCGICGRTLTDEESRARGIGPICAGKAMAGAF